MTPDQYDSWYYTARGRWIGETEFRLIMGLLEPESGARILDVGCGTGYFTRRFAGEGYDVTGLDPECRPCDGAGIRCLQHRHQNRGRNRAI